MRAMVPRHCGCKICDPAIPHASERARKRFTKQWPHVVSTVVMTEAEKTVFVVNMKNQTGEQS